MFLSRNVQKIVFFFDFHCWQPRFAVSWRSYNKYNIYSLVVDVIFFFVPPTSVLFYLKFNSEWEQLRNKWAAVALLFCSSVLSGHVRGEKPFNHGIRKKKKITIWDSFVMQTDREFTTGLRGAGRKLEIGGAEKEVVLSWMASVTTLLPPHTLVSILGLMFFKHKETQVGRVRNLTWCGLLLLHCGENVKP